MTEPDGNGTAMTEPDGNGTAIIEPGGVARRSSSPMEWHAAIARGSWWVPAGTLGSMGDALGDGVRLLVVDFGGVCTLSARELIELEQAGRGRRSLAETVRPLAVTTIAAAQTAGIVVAVLSNELSRSWAATVPLLAQVDHLFPCSDNGINKPDRRAFQRCLLVSGLAAHQTLVVDDDADNVGVAATLGMQVARFDTTDPDESWCEVGRRLGLGSECETICDPSP